MTSSFDTALGIITVLAVILSYATGVWGIYGHFLTKDRVEPGMKLTSLLSLIGIGWFLVERWQKHALTGTIGRTSDEAALGVLAIFTALFWWAVKTTRQRRLTLAFSKDQPAFIHMSGPYSWIRHPFYSSYLLFWIGTALATATWLFWIVPFAMAIIYWRAIRIEEAKFSSSSMSSEYMAYKSRTGMLLPVRLPRHQQGNAI